MSYYQGDFRPGYYQGDPFFGGLLMGIGKIAGIVKGALGRGRPSIKMLPPQVGAMGFPGGAMERVGRTAGMVVGAARGAILKHPVLSAAGAAGALGAAGAGAERMIAGPSAAHMKGFHISHKTGRVVRNRHMRVTNPKALRRALRRAHGFAKLAMRTIHLVHPKKKARFGGFRRPRARKV
jgi:hypothetical protein